MFKCIVKSYNDFIHEAIADNNLNAYTLLEYIKIITVKSIQI
jgi:hypothetical protein